MEIGYQRIDASEPVWRVNENIRRCCRVKGRPIARLLEMMFNGPDRCRADRDASTERMSQQFLSSHRHLVDFVMNIVVGDEICFYGSKCPQANMERNFGGFDTAIFDLLQYFWSEM